MKTVMYFAHLSDIGGVETFFYNMVRKYKRDIEIYYRTGNKDQIDRLREYCPVIKYEGQEIECDVAIFNYTTDIIDHVHAREKIQVVHADYTEEHLKLAKGIDRVIAVSQVAADSVGGCEVSYPPFVQPTPQKVLRLVSATRLSREKGLRRMEQFADILDRAGVRYTWDVFTTYTGGSNNPHIFFRPPDLGVIDWVAASSYLVQLSDREAFCYSVVEALSIGVPVIVTDCPVFREIGLNDKNSITVSHDLHDVPVDRIVAGLPPFKYKPPADNWGKILAKGRSKYDPSEKTEIEVVKVYLDLELNEWKAPGDVFTVTKRRAGRLEDLGFAKERKP